MIPLLTALLLGGAARAQDGSINPDTFAPPVDGTGYLHAPSASTLRHLQLATGLWFDHADDLVVLEEGGERVSPGEGAGDGLLDRRTTAHVQVALGLGGWFSLGADLPVILQQRATRVDIGTDLEVDATRLPTSGVGDLRLVPKLAVLQTGEGPVGVAFEAPFWLPTGSGAAWTGEDGLSAEPRVVLEAADGEVARRRHRWRLALLAGLNLRPADRLGDARIGSGPVAGLAAGVRPLETLEVLFEARVQGAGARVAQIAGEASLGVALHPSPTLGIRLAGGTGAVPGIGAPDYRLIAGLTWTPDLDPGARDSDRDGIADSDDSCRGVPEDLDGFEDADGCPEADNDGDGVLDPVDLCSEEAEDPDGFLDEDGCPDPDNDQDGVPDAADRCPDEAETFNDHDDDDGCPDESPRDDSDGDGYKDDVDRCPEDAEDYDGWEDVDGCPEWDNDQDGIPDVRDECPNRAEIVNAIEDEDGCPEDERVELGAGKVTLPEQVLFIGRTAELDPVSLPLIDELATALRATPAVRKLRIEAHTDNTGEEADNLRLSTARAETVAEALADRGVDPGRLDARGFGEMFPVDTNNTEAGRLRNHRLEVFVVERD